MSARPAAIPFGPRRGVRAVVPALAIVAAIVVLAPFLLPHSPDALDLAARRETPSLSHPFGTDDLGRDVLSRVVGRCAYLAGARTAVGHRRRRGRQRHRRCRRLSAAAGWTRC